MTNTFLTTRPLFPGRCEYCGSPTVEGDNCCCISCEAKLMASEREVARAALVELKTWRRYRGRKGTPGEGAMTRLAAMTDALLSKNHARRREMTRARDEAETETPE